MRNPKSKSKTVNNMNLTAMDSGNSILIIIIIISLFDLISSLQSCNYSSLFFKCTCDVFTYHLQYYLMSRVIR